MVKEKSRGHSLRYYSFYLGAIVSCHVFLFFFCFCSFSIANQFAVITKEFLHSELVRQTEKKKKIMGLFLRNMHHTNKIISYSILSLAQQRLRCIYTLSDYGSRTAHKYRYWHVLDHNRRQNSRGQVVHKKPKSWHAY